ncbi:lipoprotein [Streptomyces malachitofuscus]|nr:lipoprotein [Streptomyces malachitofuscus]
MIPISQGRSRRAVLAGAVCALLVTGTALTGCSEDPNEGTNGVGRLPADQIQSRAQQAAKSVGTVRLHGTVVTSGRTYTLDMRLKEKGGIGSVTTKGETFRLLRIDDELYLKAGAEFWGQGAGGGEDGGKADAAAAGKLAEKYVKVPQGDPSYKKFIGFTDKSVLLSGLLTLHGELATDGHHEQSGLRTIRVTGDKGSGGTLDVSLEGEPYPVRLVRAGKAGTLTFSGWGTDFPLKKPAKDETLDYGKQLPTS